MSIFWTVLGCFLAIAVIAGFVASKHQDAAFIAMFLAFILAKLEED